MGSTKKTVYLPVEDIGIDPKDRNGPRAIDLNVEKMGPLRASIARYGLKEPITVRAVTGQPHQWEIVHGHHRYRCMHDINGADPTKFGKIPCYVTSYANDNDRFEEQYRENKHWDKVCSPSGWQDLQHHILRQIGTGTFTSPYAKSGLVWDSSVFKTEASMATFKDELQKYIGEVEGFSKSQVKKIVDGVFAANGKSNPKKVRVYTSAEAKAALKSGSVPGFNGTSGDIDGGKLVYVMNTNDYTKKPALVINKLNGLFDAANTKMAAKPVEVILVGHVNADNDKSLDNQRDKMTDFVKTINNFFTTQFGGNYPFSKLVDKIYFLPQKVNRSGGLTEAKPLKVTV